MCSRQLIVRTLHWVHSLPGGLSCWPVCRQGCSNVSESGPVTRPDPKISEPAVFVPHAGAGSGFAGVLAGLPLDVVRVRQQIDLSSSRHLVAQMMSMVKLEGPATLLRGATYPLATITLQVGLCAITVLSRCD